MCYLYVEMNRGRSLSGEIRGVFSELLLRRDTVTAGGVESELSNVLALFVLVAAVQKLALDASSDDPPSQKVVADYVGNELALYRHLATPIPFQDVSGLMAFLANYRLLSQNQFESLEYRDSPGVYLDLKTKIDSISPFRVTKKVQFPTHRLGVHMQQTAIAYRIHTATHCSTVTFKNLPHRRG